MAKVENNNLQLIIILHDDMYENGYTVILVLKSQAVKFKVSFASTRFGSDCIFIFHVYVIPDNSIKKNIIIKV